MDKNVQAAPRTGRLSDGETRDAGPALRSDAPCRLRGGIAVGATMLGLGIAVQPASASEGLVKLDFVNCTASQAVQVGEAVALAAEAIDEVAARLSSDKQHPADVEALARWLGERTSRFDVLKELKHLAARLDGDQFPIVAECRPDDMETFGWTYPAMEGEGYISFGYWFFDAALVGGVDSRMGTVVHELSHMVPGTNTEDYFYDDQRIQALARIFPEVAIDNAQNLEYMVEEIFDRLNGTAPGPKSVLREPGGVHLPPFCRVCRF